MEEYYQSIEDFILTQMPHTPQDIYNKVRLHGYIGQHKAVQAISLMACRHIRRLKNVFVDKIPKDELPPKDNYLLVGPTGSGKTYLVDIVFNKILHLPTTVIDITSYSETGYIGQDVVSILTRLVNAADGNYDLAALGVVCLDEFDKLSTSKNSAVFAGQGTTKDVSGFGVQKELLKILEGAEVDVPEELSHSAYAPRDTMSTEFISFVALGAFSGITKTINHHNQQIGFGSKTETAYTDAIAYQLNENDLNKTVYFQEYGIMPELIGRFSRIVPFHPLDKAHLQDILVKNTLKRYEKELALVKSSLKIDDDVLEKIVDQAIEMETGARGLRTSLFGYIEDACFELYSHLEQQNTKIHLFLEKDKIQWEIV
ncbi:AAA family ATPase [Microscilla marina]|uniref:ATP-dependent Clp protease ATP-binding subunit ClpX n=1 Tax=Microscilla marina ATCC 23134 TaxID=313606 RepID=A1ZNM6_MICM2|nr:AAA family ATPase [Microscilla marina]EAY27915.1 ATP-dependent Clp protease ATP-binding subunit ClpX [Microscilla marina ATCC 23134]